MSTNHCAVRKTTSSASASPCLLLSKQFTKEIWKNNIAYQEHGDLSNMMHRSLLLLTKQAAQATCNNDWYTLHDTALVNKVWVQDFLGGVRDIYQWHYGHRVLKTVWQNFFVLLWKQVISLNYAFLLLKATMCILLSWKRYDLLYKAISVWTFCVYNGDQQIVVGMAVSTLCTIPKGLW